MTSTLAATVEARVSSHIDVPQALLHTKITATSAQPLTSCLFSHYFVWNIIHPFLICFSLATHRPKQDLSPGASSLYKNLNNKPERHFSTNPRTTTPFKYCRLVVHELGLLPEIFGWKKLLVDTKDSKNLPFVWNIQLKYAEMVFKNVLF